MMNTEYMPESRVGYFAYSKAGHDKGQLYTIVAQEGDCVLLCDGRLRTFASPKKKKWKHIQRTGATVDSELMARLRRGEAVRDEEIKFQIKRYLKE